MDTVLRLEFLRNDCNHSGYFVEERREVRLPELVVHLEEQDWCAVFILAGVTDHRASTQRERAVMVHFGSVQEVVYNSRHTVGEDTEEDG